MTARFLIAILTVCTSAYGQIARKATAFDTTFAADGIINTISYDSIGYRFTLNKDRELLSIGRAKFCSVRNSLEINEYTNCRAYYESGDLHYRNDLVNDTLTKLIYHENGQLKEQRVYARSNRGFINRVRLIKYCNNGRLLYYSEKRKVDSYYCNGQRRDSGFKVGPYYRYYEDGSLKVRGKYKSGRFEDLGGLRYSGKWTYYNAEGEVDSTIVYNSKGYVRKRKLRTTTKPKAN